MPPTPRKPPIKKTVPAVARHDDITDWQDSQPVVTVITDEDDLFPEDTDTPPAVVPPPEPETPPRIPSPIATKARELATKLRTNRKPPVKKTRAAKARVSVAKLISGGWQVLAQLTAPINIPVAKVIDMQAPVAGLVLEDAVKNTVIDRMLQPLARAGDGGEIAFALLGPPLIVGALTQRPHLAPVLRPVLKQALMSWVEIAGPHLETVKKKEQKFKEEYGQQIDEMIDYFFTDPMGPSPNGADATHAQHPTATAS